MARVATDIDWPEPVSAVGRGLSLVTIHGPSEAFDFLSNEWPAYQGVFYATARTAAMRALDDEGFADEARNAFMIACEDAACLVRRVADDVEPPLHSGCSDA